MRKGILIFSDWFLPGYKAGGPIRSIANLSEYLADFTDVYIFTSNHDLGDKIPYPNITNNQWVKTENGYHVYYCSTENLSQKNVKKILNEIRPDVVYINGIFSKVFSIFPLQASLKFNDARVIVAPRGMLGKGALNIKPLKKKLFLLVSKRILNLYKRVNWQATSEQEHKEILDFVGEDKNIEVIPNLSSILFQEKMFSKVKEPGSLRMVFISRISPKKNLLFALKVLSENKFSGNIYYDIFGPVEDEKYWDKCLEEIKLMPSNIIVSYKGNLQHSDVVDTISKYHVLFFPTQNENYGHVISESIMAGNLLVLSDQTPWRRLKQLEIGFDLPLNNSSAFVDAISELLSLNQVAYQKMLNKLKVKANEISQQEQEKSINKNYFLKT